MIDRFGIWVYNGYNFDCYIKETKPTGSFKP